MIATLAVGCQALGGAIAAFAYVPQLRQLLRTRSAGGLSLGSLRSLCLAIALMEIYAVTLVATEGTGVTFLATNTLSLVLVAGVTATAARYQRIEQGDGEQREGGEPQ